MTDEEFDKVKSIYDLPLEKRAEYMEKWAKEFQVNIDTKYLDKALSEIRGRGIQPPCDNCPNRPLHGELKTC